MRRHCEPVYLDILQSWLSFKVINNNFLLKNEEGVI